MNNTRYKACYIAKQNIESNWQTAFEVEIKIRTLKMTNTSKENKVHSRKKL